MDQKGIFIIKSRQNKILQYWEGWTLQYHVPCLDVLVFDWRMINLISCFPILDTSMTLETVFFLFCFPFYTGRLLFPIKRVFLVGACFLNFYFWELKQIECIDKCIKCWILAIFSLAVSSKKFAIALLTQKFGNKVLKFLFLKWFWHKRKTLLYRRIPLRFCLNNGFGIAKELPKLCKHWVG